MLRIDTVESAGRAGGAQQFLSFLICGSGHSDSLGTKLTPQPSPRGGRKGNLAGSLALWMDPIPCAPSASTIKPRSMFVNQVYPLKVHRKTPIAAEDLPRSGGWLLSFSGSRLRSTGLPTGLFLFSVIPTTRLALCTGEGSPEGTAADGTFRPSRKRACQGIKTGTAPIRR
jgi:hypothetical protein